MASIKTIVGSWFINGDDLPEWYQDRLDKCLGCVYNSKNNGEKKVFNRVYENILGAHCLDCGCVIENKAKVPTQQCPKKFWLAQQPLSPSEIKLEYIEGPVSFGFDIGRQRYSADYEEIRYNSDSEFKVQIKDTDITDIKISVSCGCVTYNLEGNTIIVKYDTTRKGAINSKDLIIDYMKNNKKRQTVIDLKGTVR